MGENPFFPPSNPILKKEMPKKKKEMRGLSPSKMRSVLMIVGLVTTEAWLPNSASLVCPHNPNTVMLGAVRPGKCAMPSLGAGMSPLLHTRIRHRFAGTSGIVTLQGSAGVGGGNNQGGGSKQVRYTGEGFRVVKCFPQLARRQADQAVQDGRVTVNGERASPALRLRGGDVLTLDGRRVDWEELAVASEQGGGEKFVYFKYHKPLNVASTWDKNDRSSILHHLPPDMLTRKGGGQEF